ncbi:MAG TPA: glycosyltransferase family 4 protein [Longimicrobium sp.]|nr:glycosyltransferase family 4 protein [Longimicrobium sp.]
MGTLSSAPASNGAAPTTVLVLGGYAQSLVTFRGSLLRAMAARGHRVVACAPAASPAIVETLTAMGVTYRDVPFNRTGLRPDEDLRTLAALVALFREVRPDVILSYTIKPVIWGLLAARIARVPRRFAMITGLGYAFMSEGREGRVVRNVARRLYQLSLRGADRVFFQNPDDRATFERMRLVRGPAQGVIVNGSGVEIDHYRPVPFPEGPTSFLLMGRFLADKGVREYVEAARMVRARHPEAVFRMAGWPDENPTSISEEELAAWLREGVVEFLGGLSDVRPSIAAATVYVLPSYGEGTPRSVLEAMAMGRPIVTTDAPGCRETVQDGVNGFLVPVRDAAALARAMEALVADRALVERMGRESRRIAEEKYDVHKVNRVILETMGLAGPEPA